MGIWQSHLRSYYKKKKLSPERIKRLEEIGFTWELLEEAFDKGFEETVRYKEQHGNPNASALHITADGFKLGLWQNNNRSNYKTKKLSLERIRRLEEIGFTWELLEDEFEKGFEETVKHKEQFGTANAPQSYITYDGFKLGSWQNTKRKQYKKGKLSPKRVKLLEEIGFTWDILEVAFEKGFIETVKYKKQNGTPDVPNKYITSNGFKLGIWQSHLRSYYKEKKLSPERIKRLEQIGFTWDILEEAFDKGFEETLRYKEQYGTPNAPALYNTSDKFNLGSWQSTQRAQYKSAKLLPERVKRLEEIGFVWEPYEEAFEAGFEKTVRYKKQYGNPNAPQRHVTSEGFNLGIWQSTQRVQYKSAKLLPERIKRLEEIGFVWNPFEEAFERGMEETLKYRKQYGTPNAPNSYVTSDGFKLGSWQGNQRANYKANRISPERIARLEKIGFNWRE